MVGVYNSMHFPCLNLAPLLTTAKFDVYRYCQSFRCVMLVVSSFKLLASSDEECLWRFGKLTSPDLIYFPTCSLHTQLTLTQETSLEGIYRICTALCGARKGFVSNTCRQTLMCKIRDCHCHLKKQLILKGSSDVDKDYINTLPTVALIN